MLWFSKLRMKRAKKKSKKWNKIYNNLKSKVNGKNDDNLSYTLNWHHYKFLRPKNIIVDIVLILSIVAIFEFIGKSIVHNVYEVNISWILSCSILFFLINMFYIYKNVKEFKYNYDIRVIIRRVFFKTILIYNIVIVGCVSLTKTNKLLISNTLYLIFIAMTITFGTIIIYDMFIDDLQELKRRYKRR